MDRKERNQPKVNLPLKTQLERNLNKGGTG